MPRLSDYPPCEPESLEHAKPDWVSGPCGQSKKSNPLTRANFDALLDRLDSVDPYGEDWEIVRFPHFAVGWMELVFVRPGSQCAEIATQTRNDMAEYPCIDQDLWVEYEVKEKP